jgi:hypothetical protein
MRSLMAAVSLALSGCAVYVPGAVVDATEDALTGNRGRHCVPTIAKIGDHILIPDGRIGVVEKLEGSTPRCADRGHPIRAVLVFP